MADNSSNGKLGLRDYIYIGTILVGLTVHITHIKAQTDQQQRFNSKLERLLEGIDSRVDNLEIVSAKNAAFREGFEAGKAAIE